MSNAALTSLPNALLLTLGELVHKELSAEALLKRIVDVMTQLMDADRGSVFLLDDDADELVAIAAHLPEIERLRVPRSQGVAGYVARTGRVVNVPHCSDDVRFWREVDARTGYRTRTMLAGPLHDQRGQLIGVVQFLNKREGNFSAEDEATFDVLSEQVASLLDATTLGAPATLLPDANERAVPINDRINGIVGSSEPMRRVFRLIKKVAPTDAIVLLRGESGTGKGLVARAIHHNSRRGDAPLVHVDCTTLPDGLMENELFGHERGAYTGADRRAEGKVAQAEGGTLFLDEIGDLPPALQGKLLTLVQDRRYSRVGGTRSLDADIRIVAATNRDLERLVNDGVFREDLYYRLRVAQIDLPPLRERGVEDLRQLVAHFVSVAERRHGRTIDRIDPTALQMLLQHAWPGNVRELQNCLESAVIFCDGTITPSTLSLPQPGRTQQLRAVVPTATRPPRTAPVSRTPELGGAGPVSTPFAAIDPRPFADEPTMSELEGRYIAWLLERHDGNRSACARVMGIGRNTLLRKIREHGLDGAPS